MVVKDKSRASASYYIVKMLSPFTRRKKAEYTRKLTRTNYEQKRFNVPLREFLRVKYQDTLNEYAELYNDMDTKHPKRRSLVDCPAFLEWKEKTEVDKVDETSSDGADKADETSNDEADKVDETSNDEADDLISVALRETFRDGEVIGAIYDVEPNREENLLVEADEIIDELLGQEEIRNIMEDEGIELNIEDEIYYDIEPFNFEIEVESYES